MKDLEKWLKFIENKEERKTMHDKKGKKITHMQGKKRKVANVSYQINIQNKMYFGVNQN